MSGQTGAGSARLNAYHGTKRQLLGSSAGQVSPAWRTSDTSSSSAPLNGNAAHLSKKTLQRGSKILLSNLPMDVAETEIEELFKRTIGPMKDMFIIYNSQGRSKGMAVVTFQRLTDAGLARSKYNGKVIDGKHKLKIELVTDTDEPLPKAPNEQPFGLPSLLSRISGPHQQLVPISMSENGVSIPSPPRPMKKNAFPIMVSSPKKRMKKGPRRVKKSVAQLDQEMEDYRASAAVGQGP